MHIGENVPVVIAYYLKMLFLDVKTTPLPFNVFSILASAHSHSSYLRMTLIKVVIQIFTGVDIIIYGS